MLLLDFTNAKSFNFSCAAFFRYWIASWLNWKSFCLLANFSWLLFFDFECRDSISDGFTTGHLGWRLALASNLFALSRFVIAFSLSIARSWDWCGGLWPCRLWWLLNFFLLNCTLKCLCQENKFCLGQTQHRLTTVCSLDALVSSLHTIEFFSYLIEHMLLFLSDLKHAICIVPRPMLLPLCQRVLLVLVWVTLL